MKKTILAIVLAIFVMGAYTPSFAQASKEAKKEMKDAKKEVKSNASRAARKEARKLKRQGWLVVPGALALDKQLDRSWMMQYEYDEKGAPKYFMGEAMSIGENYDAAKSQAVELAKQNLAGQIQTEITALIENTVSNKQLAQEQAVSITQTVAASKNLISQKIGMLQPVTECYRVKDNKNKEVLVRFAYNKDAAYEAAKQVIRDELEKKGEDLHKQLDQVLGF